MGKMGWVMCPNFWSWASYFRSTWPKKLRKDKEKLGGGFSGTCAYSKSLWHARAGRAGTYLLVAMGPTRDPVRVTSYQTLWHHLWCQYDVMWYLMMSSWHQVNFWSRTQYFQSIWPKNVRKRPKNYRKMRMGCVSRLSFIGTVFPVNMTKKKTEKVWEKSDGSCVWIFDRGHRISHQRDQKKYERYHVSEFLVAGTVFPINVTKIITERYGKIGRGFFAHTRSSREAARETNSST